MLGNEGGPNTYKFNNAEIAQLVEHWSEEPGVVSSILTLGTSLKELSCVT